jgi:hypothetical protein
LSPVITLLVASALIGGSIGMAARAHADPESVESYAFRNATAICSMLGQDDSDAGVTAVALKLFAAGVDPKQAGTVLLLAVQNVCPSEMDALLRWAHTVTPSQASGHIGGAVGA